MKYCSHCGAQADDGAKFCSNCGSSFTQTGFAAQEADAPSIGFAVLCFFFPIVGLILYLVWKDTYPLRAKSCGKGALISVIVDAVLVILTVLFYVLLFVLILGFAHP